MTDRELDKRAAVAGRALAAMGLTAWAVHIFMSADLAAAREFVALMSAAAMLGLAFALIYRGVGR